MADFDPHVFLANIRNDEPYDIYIGRPSVWGNPFKVGFNGDRDLVIDLHARWIVQQEDLMAQIHDLRGKVLGCFCSPKRCHGEILVRLANGEL